MKKCTICNKEKEKKSDSTMVCILCSKRIDDHKRVQLIVGRVLGFQPGGDRFEPGNPAPISNAGLF